MSPDLYAMLTAILLAVIPQSVTVFQGIAILAFYAAASLMMPPRKRP